MKAGEIVTDRNKSKPKKEHEENIKKTNRTNGKVIVTVTIFSMSKISKLVMKKIYYSTKQVIDQCNNNKTFYSNVELLNKSEYLACKYR